MIVPRLHVYDARDCRRRSPWSLNCCRETQIAPIAPAGGRVLTCDEART
jgi:hypothetical protein